MIKDENQNQEGGDSSTNLQGKNITINQGISYSDAKEIALDVYKANFLDLSQEAASLARERAEELTDNFLEKLKKDNVQAIGEMKSPGMQAAIFEAQKQYAKTGDKDLEGLLVDILVERAGSSERNIHQIVLDESLGVASKLTAEQMDALTVNFIITQTKNNSLINLPTFLRFLDKDILQFLPELTDSSSCYEHLEYVGCGTVNRVTRRNSVEEIFKNQYPGLFSKGFNQSDFDEITNNVEFSKKQLMPCLHYPNLLQFRAGEVDLLDIELEKAKIELPIRKKIKSLFTSSTMTASDIKKYIVQNRPEVEKLFRLWSESSISQLTPTTVGISIAHANYRRRTGVKLNLSEWVK